MILVPVPDTKAATLAVALLEKWVLVYGTCVQLSSDNGSCFTSEFFKEFSRLLAIRNRYSVPWNSQSNGAVERVHHTVQSMISKLIDPAHESWEDLLPYVQWCYNSATHDTTGYSPYPRSIGDPRTSRIHRGDDHEPQTHVEECVRERAIGTAQNEGAVRQNCQGTEPAPG